MRRTGGPASAPRRAAGGRSRARPARFAARRGRRGCGRRPRAPGSRASPPMRRSFGLRSPGRCEPPRSRPRAGSACPVPPRRPGGGRWCAARRSGRRSRRSTISFSMRRSTRPDSATAWSAGGIAPDPEHGHLSTIRSRAARWNGLPIGSSIPASRNIRICSGRTLAVMARIGIAAAARFRGRMRRAASPSMPDIRTSISTRSKAVARRRRQA